MPPRCTTHLTREPTNRPLSGGKMPSWTLPGLYFPRAVGVATGQNGRTKSNTPKGTWWLPVGQFRSSLALAGFSMGEDGIQNSLNRLCSMFASDGKFRGSQLMINSVPLHRNYNS